ncbi:MAG: FtsX-like permease family protein, partial [Acidobacteriota bacterium]
RVARHYLQFSLTLVALGGVAGVPVGLWLGMKLTGVYTAFFHFPQLVFRTSPMAIVVSLGVTALAAGAAAIGAVRAVVALPPAEGMRGETPLRFRRGLVERIGAPRLLSPAVRMLLRNLERRPIRALLSIVAIAMAVAILVVTLFSFDALESVIAIQFRMAQNDDVQLSLQTPAARGALTSLRSLPGVLRMEPVRTVLVKISSRQRMRRVPLIGMERSNELRRIVDARGHVAELPAGGLLLTVKLAEVLGVVPGDVVTVEAIEGSRPQARMQVADTVEEMIGMSAYASREDVNAFLREGDVVSGAWLAIDGASASELYRRLKKMPGIATVELREVMLQSFRDTIEKNNTMTVSVVAMFACIVAFGMVYNSSRIALSERGRDLATLRVLGFSSREVGVMLVGEQAILTALGIPLGFGFGYGLAWAVAKLYDSEQFRIPLVLSGRTFAFAFAVVAASAAISALLVQRRVASLDLVEVLKTRE